MRAVLALDQGSSGTRVLALDEDAEVVAAAQSPLSTSYPRPGWAEQDAYELWDSVERALSACVEMLPPGTQVAAVGVANQRESALAWDRRSGAPAGPCVSWQCGRGAAACRRAAAELGAARVQALSGLPLSPAYSAAKWSWLLEQPAVRSLGEQLACGTVDSWLAWQLSAGAQHVCDTGNASRTQLFDLVTLDWSPELLAAFAMPRSALPTPGPSAGLLGECRAPAAVRGAALGALCGDSHAALYSHGVGVSKAAGEALVKATYGTGSSVLAGAPAPGARGAAAGALSWSVVWRLDEVSFGFEGNVAAAGAALEWGVRLLSCDDFATFEAIAAAAGPSPVIAVPALAGLGPPWLAPGAQGVLDGLSLASGQGEVAHALFEGVAHQVADIVELLGACQIASGRRCTEVLHADGGLSRSGLLMQLQADLLGIEVRCAARHEASALGAGYLAGIAAGLWQEGDLTDRLPAWRRFEPRLAEQRRTERRERWRVAAGRCAEVAGRAVGVSSEGLQSACSPGRW